MRFPQGMSCDGTIITILRMEISIGNLTFNFKE